jgi:hypothetical protein
MMPFISRPKSHHMGESIPANWTVPLAISTFVIPTVVVNRWALCCVYDAAHGGLDNGNLAVWGVIMTVTVVAMFYGKRAFRKRSVAFDNEIFIYDA